MQAPENAPKSEKGPTGVDAQAIPIAMIPVATSVASYTAKISCVRSALLHPLPSARSLLVLVLVLVKLFFKLA